LPVFQLVAIANGIVQFFLDTNQAECNVFQLNGKAVHCTAYYKHVRVCNWTA